MAKYLNVAAEARNSIDSLMELIPEDRKREAVCLIAHVYNLGIRTAPRPTQATVRERAVKCAMENQPVSVTMSRREGTNGRSFNVIDIKPLVTASADDKSNFGTM